MFSLSNKTVRDFKNFGGMKYKRDPLKVGRAFPVGKAGKAADDLCG